MLFAPLAVLLGVWLVGPAVLGFLATLTTYTPTGHGIDFRWFSNYATVLRNRQLIAGIRNVAVFTLVAVPLELAIGFGLAYLLRRPFRGRGLWRVLLLLPWLVSPIASGVMWHFVLGSSNGIIDFGLAALGLPSDFSPLGQKGLALATTVLVEVWRMAPLVAFLLVPGLSSIPDERWEQGTIDGLSWPGRVRDIALPAVRPLLLAITLLLIGASLGTFDSLVVMTGGGPGSETMMPALYTYQQAFQFSDWSAGAASAWLIGGALLIVGLAYLRLSRSDDG